MWSSSHPCLFPGFSEFSEEMDQGVWRRVEWSGSASDTWFVRRVPNLYKMLLTIIVCKVFGQSTGHKIKVRERGSHLLLIFGWFKWSEGLRASLSSGSPSDITPLNCSGGFCRFDSCAIRFGPDIALSASPSIAMTLNWLHLSPLIDEMGGEIRQFREGSSASSKTPISNFCLCSSTW